MPTFKYKAIAPAGEAVQGVIRADSLEMAKEHLRREKLIVTKLFTLTHKEKQKILNYETRLSFTRDMAQLLKAGLPVYESLITVEEKFKAHPSHSLFTDISKQVREGKSLSLAIGKYPESFNGIYVAMVSCAERSGSLAKAFEELYQLLMRQNKLKRQLIAALTYPALLAGFCLIVVTALFFFVIPSMKELFEDRALHPFTVAVLAISDGMRRFGPALALIGTLGICGAGFALRSLRGRLFIYKTLHKIYLVKKILMHAALIRFSRTLSLLLSSGVGMIDALLLSKNVTRHPFIEAAIDQGIQKVLEGEKLSAQFISDTLPPLVPRMMAIAEETGKMPGMLYSLAEIYEEELERHLGQITSLLQPLLLLLLGLIIGVVVLAILLPLTDVSSFISD